MLIVDLEIRRKEDGDVVILLVGGVGVLGLDLLGSGIWFISMWEGGRVPSVNEESEEV
jgi:hypothetical protein